jgi:hypothetical protein
MTTAERALDMYNEWDNITAIYFKIVDSINVLSLILLVEEASTPRGKMGPVQRPNLYYSKSANYSYPASVPYVPMIEIYPIDKDPFLTTAQPQPPLDEPEVEDIPWDSGPEDIPWDEGGEAWAAAMRERVRVALAKLEFVRRWIGKIRKTMIWYRAMPIEKFAPKNDQSQNPFKDALNFEEPDY